MDVFGVSGVGLVRFAGLNLLLYLGEFVELLLEFEAGVAEVCLVFVTFV